MKTPSEITSETLREARGHRTQADIAALLGLTVPKVSNIERGKRTLTVAEQRLLEWHLLGIVPPRVTAGPPSSELTFSPSEWEVIRSLAERSGMTQPEWIAAKIRDYLDYLESRSAESMQPKKSLDAASRMNPLRTVPEPPSSAKKGCVGI
jgi:transcriptional regulator with XRE-family HTH domain